MHLKQQHDLQKILGALYIQSQNSHNHFASSLQEHLKNSGINIVTYRNEAQTIMIIQDMSFSNLSPGIYSSTQASVYTFTLTVTFQLETGQGKNILMPLTISLSRPLTLGPNEILESSNQVATLEQEMQQEMNIRIVNILNARQIAENMKR